MLLDGHLFIGGFLLLASVVQAVPFLSNPYQNFVDRDVQVAPTPPSDDPFYVAGGNYGNIAPGSIISHRRVPTSIAALGLIPVPLKDAFQISYRTTDSLGQPTMTVTTVLVPLLKTDYTKVLAYQVAEDASYINCAPSYALQFMSRPGGPAGTALTQAEIAAITTALLNGWIVTVPDYQGQKAAFLAQKNSGQSTLDAIRATLSSGSFTGVDSKARAVLWGYSGGSHATSIAIELQPSYAPDLSGRIVGAAIGGTVPNITNAVYTLEGSTSAGLIAIGVNGLAHEFPAVRALLNDPSVVKPETAADFFSTNKRCLIANQLHFFGKKIFETYFTNPDFTTFPVLADAFANAGTGTASPQVPVFIYKSVKDNIGYIGDTDKLYEGYCAGGTIVTYNRHTSSDHVTLFVIGIPAAFNYLKDRLNDVPVASACVRRDTATGLADDGDLVPPQVLAKLEELYEDAKNNGELSEPGR